MKVGDKVKHLPSGTVGYVDYIVGDKVTLLVGPTTDDKKAFIGLGKFEVVQTKEEVDAAKPKVERKPAVEGAYKYRFTPYEDLLKKIEETPKVDIYENVKELKDLTKFEKEKAAPKYKVQMDQSSVDEFWNTIVDSIDPRDDFETIQTTLKERDESYDLLESTIESLNMFEASGRKPTAAQIKFFKDLFFNAKIQNFVQVIVNEKEAFTITYENGRLLSTGPRLSGTGAVGLNILRQNAQNVEWVQRLIHDSGTARETIKQELEEIEKRKPEFKGTDVNYSTLQRRVDTALEPLKYISTKCGIRIISNGKVYGTEENELKASLNRIIKNGWL